MRYINYVTAPVAAPPSPTPLRARALGPDLARGVMLLFIAVANSHYFLRGDAHLGGFPLGGSAVDRAASWAISTFVDGRAFPMFGLLFGYGVAHVVRRNASMGKWFTRRLLWRRSAVLVAVGVVDGLLFYAGDILAMYGVLLFVAAFVVFWRDGWLLGWAALLLALTSMPAPGAVGTDGPDASLLPPDVASMFASHGVAVLVVALGGPFGFAFPFLIGLLAGRRRILEQPERYRRLLVVVAVLGIGLAVAGAQPVALPLAGLGPVPSSGELEVVGTLHAATGTFGGFGYAALIPLLAARIERRHGHQRGRLLGAVAATGQRSMTCYLAQSPVWALVFAPFLLDLSDDLTITATVVLAIVVWLATVFLADLLRRAGRRGPFESLVRRVTYRTSRRTQETDVRRPGAEPLA